MASSTYDAYVGTVVRIVVCGGPGGVVVCGGCGLGRGGPIYEPKLLPVTPMIPLRVLRVDRPFRTVRVTRLCRLPPVPLENGVGEVN